jgi:hypothetical protein
VQLYEPDLFIILYYLTIPHQNKYNEKVSGQYQKVLAGKEVMLFSTEVFM